MAHDFETYVTVQHENSLPNSRKLNAISPLTLADNGAGNTIDLGLGSGALDVAHGGTGATTASGARTNLGAAEFGVNSSITALTGLVTSLPLSEGGTGGTDAPSARHNLQFPDLTNADPSKVLCYETGATGMQWKHGAIINQKRISGTQSVQMDSQCWIEVDTSTGPATINLGNPGTVHWNKVLIFKKVSTDTNSITLIPPTGVLIECASSYTFSTPLQVVRTITSVTTGSPQYYLW